MSSPDDRSSSPSRKSRERVISPLPIPACLASLECQAQTEVTNDEHPSPEAPVPKLSLPEEWSPSSQQSNGAECPTEASERPEREIEEDISPDVLSNGAHSYRLDNGPVGDATGLPDSAEPEKVLIKSAIEKQTHAKSCKQVVNHLTSEIPADPGKPAELPPSPHNAAFPLLSNSATLSEIPSTPKRGRRRVLPNAQLSSTPKVELPPSPHNAALPSLSNSATPSTLKRGRRRVLPNARLSSTPIVEFPPSPHNAALPSLSNSATPSTPKRGRTRLLPNAQLRSTPIVELPPSPHNAALPSLSNSATPSTPKRGRTRLLPNAQLRSTPIVELPPSPHNAALPSLSNSVTLSATPSTLKRGRRRVLPNARLSSTPIVEFPPSHHNATFPSLSNSATPSTPKRGRPRVLQNARLSSTPIVELPPSPHNAALPLLRNSATPSATPSTPKRGRRRVLPIPRLSSTPVANASLHSSSPLRSEAESSLSNTPSIPGSLPEPSPAEQAALSEVLPCNRGRGKPRKPPPAGKTKAGKKKKGAEHSDAPPPAKRSRKKGVLAAGRANDTQPPPHSRPRFEPQEVDVQEPVETTLSSDLSIELSLQEDPLLPSPQLSWTPVANTGLDSPSPFRSDAESSLSNTPNIPDSLPEPSPAEQAALSEVLPCNRGRGKTRKPPPTGKTKAGKKKKGAEHSDAPPPAKRSRKKGVLAAGRAKPNDTQPPPHSRPRFEPQEVDVQEPVETTLSSDLSIELSLQEDPLNHSLSLHEEDEDDDEELPSFLLQMERKPLSITEGLCVWCKLRKYPFWPAMVKSVNHKNKKASIVFIDGLLFDKKIRKGFSVSLRTLKPFDCEESEQLVGKAKEKYGTAISWCLELISDYRIRIGCGSFVGSFIEYFADDISCPVRRKYPQGTSDLTFPSQLILEEQCETSDDQEEGSKDQRDERDELLSKKLLPDRSKAARNRANQKLVHFIVKKRGAEQRLLAIIGGQESSKWLQALLKASRSVVDTYLEDEEQVDQVYTYLKELYDCATQIDSSLASLDRIRFILDVLLPEAIIRAIAGVDKMSLEKAEGKYRKGPCFSNRERQEFDMMIEQQMKAVKTKAVTRCQAH